MSQLPLVFDLAAPTHNIAGTRFCMLGEHWVPQSNWHVPEHCCIACNLEWEARTRELLERLAKRAERARSAKAFARGRRRKHRPLLGPIQEGGPSARGT